MHAPDWPSCGTCIDQHLHAHFPVGQGYCPRFALITVGRADWAIDRTHATAFLNLLELISLRYQKMDGLHADFQDLGPVDCLTALEKPCAKR